LINEITSVMETLKEDQRSYFKVSKLIGVSRSLFSSYYHYTELFEKEDTLKNRYYAYAKLPKNKRMKKQGEVLSMGVNILKKKGIEITQSALAREIGVSRAIFFRNPEFKTLLK